MNLYNMLPSVPRRQAQAFTWTQGNGIAEASSLNFAPGSPPYGRVWCDACDAGIWIDNQITGRKFLFLLDREERVEGELRAWHFVSYDGRKFHLTILND